MSSTEVEVEVERIAASVASSAEGRLVAAAESCTSGRIATALASTVDATASFRGGIVAYHETIKRLLLGVEAPSVFCEQAAEEMAFGAAALMGADASVATTGVLGDEPVDGVAPGTVFIATCVDGVCRSTAVETSGQPADRSDQATMAALQLLGEHLNESNVGVAVPS